MQLRQSNVAEELLRDLPGAVPSIGSAVNNGNGGASFADLRGLGNFRNLVLLDGQRITPSSVVGRVDLNNIPLALVDRVDTLTGGAATTYGADAVSGVINFITRRDFAGMELAASSQITEEGDGHIFRADLTVGANFDDGRGNAVLSLGYQQADPIYQGARRFSLNNYTSTTGAVGGSGTTVPARFSRPGSTGGFDQINPTTGALVNPVTNFNFNPYNIFQTPFERFNIFGAAHYEVADGIEVYSRGMFSKNRVNTIIAPSGVFSSLLQIPVSNPYPAGRGPRPVLRDQRFQSQHGRNPDAHSGAVRRGGNRDFPDGSELPLLPDHGRPAHHRTRAASVRIPDDHVRLSRRSPSRHYRHDRSRRVGSVRRVAERAEPAELRAHLAHPDGRLHHQHDEL